MSQSIRTVFYGRMSDDKQETSIPEQREWLAGVKVRENLDVMAEFSDPGIPGDEIRHRPGLQELLEYCEREHRAGRPVEALACWGFERFSNPGSKGPLVEEGWPLVARTMQAAGRRPVLHRLGTTIELDIQITELVRSFGRASASRRTTPKSGICRERDELIVRGNFTLKVKQ